MSAISDDGKSLQVQAALSPFKIERQNYTVAEGLTISEIFDVIQPDPALRRAAHVYVGEMYVPRKNWHRVRPKNGHMITVRAFVPPQGGGGGKALLRNILLIAVAAAALAFGPALGGVLGLSGAFGASVGQAIIGIGGMLLVNALIPPRTNSDQTEDSPTKFIEGARNRQAPFDVVPKLFGSTRVYPLLAADPITEIVGDDQYLRMLFMWSIDQISLDDATLKIGETLLSDFTDVEIEHRYGLPGDTPPTLYPNAVEQDNFQITLNEVDGYATRTTAANADEIGVDIVFPGGLVRIDNEGKRSNRSVAVQIQYSIAGANDWRSIPVAGSVQTWPANWNNTSGGLWNQVTFTSKKTQAVRHGVTWKVHTPGAQYDVRIKRLTADTDDDQIQDDLAWSALRRITDDPPVNTSYPVALTALRIKATDQLNGVIDEFSGIPWVVCPDWDNATDTWITRATRNPASLFRHALQSKWLQAPKPDGKIDLEQLQYWHEFNVAHGFTFDQNRDFASSLWECLTDIAAAGRATPQLVDGKYTVVIDEPKQAVSHVTPRNSSGFRASKAFVTYPHAFRVQFQNRDKDFRQDEVIVYLDGYDATTATVFETIEFPGVTDPEAIYTHARYYAAVAKHRPEVWTYRQDMERFVYKRGDVVKITHDVLLVGLSFGRIKTVELDIDGNCTGITVDAPVIMEESVSYGVSIRTPGNPAVTAECVTVVGKQNSFDFVTAIPAADAPEPGDLYGFGVLGSETDEALILSVSPEGGENYKATIAAVPYRPIIFDIDAGPIPPFDSKITPIATVPDVTILGVRSDETALTVGAGESLSVHIAIKVQAINDNTGQLDVQVRPSTTQEPFTAAQVDAFIANEAFVGDVRTGEYWDIRVRWIVSGRQPGEWSYINNHFVVGKSANPQPLTGLTISTYNGQAFFRWDQPRELDVIFGGEVRFRFSADPVPEWANSTSIGQAAQARALFATLPLKSGTYMARVFDEAGNQSSVVMVDSNQASVLTYAPVDTIDQAPDFLGTKDNVIIDGIALKIGGGGAWDDMPDVDAIPDIDAFGGVAAVVSGTYFFDGGFDFTVKKKVRLTTRVLAGVFGVDDLIDAWLDDIDSRGDWDGSDTADADCVVYVAQTDDDPAGSPTWGTWERLDSMEVDCRACKFKAVQTSYNQDFNIAVTELGVDAEEIT